MGDFNDDEPGSSKMYKKPLISFTVTIRLKKEAINFG